MKVRVLCDDDPPEALVRAALETRNCPSCGGLIELDRFGGSWFAALAHARSCAWCSPAEPSAPPGQVIHLADYRRT